jgi:hypothetical protein
MNLLALDENVNVGSITVTGAANPGQNSQIAGVKLVVDANSNGTYESGTDGPFLGSAQTFGGGSTVTFTVNRVLTQSTAEDWLVLYDFGAGHSHLDAFTSSLNSATDVTATGVTSSNTPNIDVSPAPITGNAMTVSISGALAIADGGQTPGNSTQPSSTSDVLMLHFSVTETTSMEGATLNNLRFVLAGGGTPVGNPQADIAQLRLFRDDGDASFEPGGGASDDPVVASGSVSGSNDVTLTSLGETIPSGGTVSYYVAIDIAAGAQIGSTFSLSLADSDVGATGNTSSATLPVSGGTLNAGTVTIGVPAGTLTVAAASGDSGVPNFARRTDAVTNADATAAIFTLTPTGEGAVVSSMTLTHMGNANGQTHISAIRLYADVGTTAGQVDGSDVALASVSTGYGGGGTVTLTLGSPRTVPLGSPEDWIVAYDLSNACPYGRTFQVRIAAPGNVTAVGATSSSAMTILGTPATSGSRSLTGSWLQINPTGTPPGMASTGNTLSAYASVYDAMNNRMVVHGGYDDARTASYTFFPDTYALDFTTTPPNWVQIDDGTLTNAPPALAFHSAIYYTVGNTPYMLLWGGRTAAAWPWTGPTQNVAYLLDLSGPTWTRPTMTNTPNPTAHHGAAYDQANNRMLVFGGYDGTATSYTNGVFALDLTTWVWSVVIANGSAGAPTIRGDCTVVHDTSSTPTRLLVHGGWGSGTFSDTFALSLGSTPAWSTLTDSAVTRTEHPYCLDTTANQTLVWSGWPGSGSNLTDLQAHDLALGSPGGTWAYSTTNGSPGGRYWAKGVWDSSANRFVIYGGELTMGSGYADVWSFR